LARAVSRGCAYRAGCRDCTIIWTKQDELRNISSAKVNSKSADATELRIERIGNGIEPVDLKKDEAPVQLDIEKLMKLYSVPGLSVAVIEDYKSRG